MQETLWLVRLFAKPATCLALPCLDPQITQTPFVAINSIPSHPNAKNQLQRVEAALCVPRPSVNARMQCKLQSSRKTPGHRPLFKGQANGNEQMKMNAICCARIEVCNLAFHDITPFLTSLFPSSRDLVNVELSGD